MTKMRPIVKEWYDYLADGQIKGMKCKECGAVEFPPVPVCGKCSCMEMEWCDVSGEGEITTFSYSPTGIHPYTMDPVLTGYGKMKEGNYFATGVLDMGAKEQRTLLEELKKGPIPFKLEVVKLDDKVSFPFMRLER